MKKSETYEVVIVEKTGSFLLDGVYVREQGQIDHMLKMASVGFESHEDMVNCAALIAKFLTDVRKWA